MTCELRIDDGEMCIDSLISQTCEKSGEDSHQIRGSLRVACQKLLIHWRKASGSGYPVPDQELHSRAPDSDMFPIVRGEVI